MKALKFSWATLRKEGCSYLCVRNMNEDPVENLFCNIRQHGIANTNPTSFQFNLTFYYHFLWTFLQQNGHECLLHDIFLQWF